MRTRLRRGAAAARGPLSRWADGPPAAMIPGHVRVISGWALLRSAARMLRNRRMPSQGPAGSGAADREQLPMSRARGVAMTVAALVAVGATAAVALHPSPTSPEAGGGTGPAAT